VVLLIKPRASYMVGKNSITELHPKHIIVDLTYYRV
jgi:hypothetical protein